MNIERDKKRIELEAFIEKFKNKSITKEEFESKYHTLVKAVYDIPYKPEPYIYK